MQLRFAHVALVLMLGSIACRSTRAPRAPTLPEYTPSEAAAFDDLLSARLFQNSFLSRRESSDQRFAQRAASADGIWLVKVATVTREAAPHAAPKFSVSMQPIETVAGPNLTAPIALSIDAGNPCFPWIEAAGDWAGAEFLLLARRFRVGSGVEVHFHGEPDLPEIRRQILEIRAGRALDGGRGAD